MTEPLCKIARENGGHVPIDCLFGCQRDCDLPGYTEHSDSRQPRQVCNRCGSTDVRWRLQGGKWVLFSLKPGVEHRCEIDDSGFEVIDEIPEDERLW